MIYCLYLQLGLMSPFIRAAAYALQEMPVVNAGVFTRIRMNVNENWVNGPSIYAYISSTKQCFLVIDQDEIVYRHFVDISVAVATPKVVFV